MEKMDKKDILVPLDFTEKAEAGLASAVNIAKRIDARLNLLHIIDEPSPAEFQPDADMLAKHRRSNEHEHFMIELINKRNRQLHALTNRYQLDQTEVRSTIEFGKFQDRLQHYLKENDIDFIVMGSSGETSPIEWFKGNHAARAMRVSDVPILVVKAYHSLTQRGNLLLLVDLKEYSKRVIRQIKNFAELFDLQLHIAHIEQSKDATEEDILGRLQQFADFHGFTHYQLHVIGRGKKSEQITDFSRRWKIDLVCSISDGDSGLMRLFFGSDTEKFLNDLDQPILALCETQD